MVTGLLDTNVIVDVLRSHAPALTWLENQQTLGVSRIVWLEVIQGAENRKEQQRALRPIKRFTLLELTVEDFEWATRALLQFNLSHNVSAMDCLIASVSHRLQLPLYTQNLKHFAPLVGSLAVKPY